MVDQTGVSWNRAVLWLREISGLLERGSDSAWPQASDLHAHRPGILPKEPDMRSVCTAYASGSRSGHVNTERQVRLFRNGRNQALRIPRDLELPGRAATLRKEGARLIVEPLAGPSLLAVLAKLKPLDEEFPPIPRPSAEPVEF